MALIHLHVEQKRVMHSHTCLMIHPEALNMLVCQGIGEDIIPSGGGMSAMCSASIVTWLCAPPVGLGSNINEVIGVQCLIKARESSRIPI